MKLTLIFLMSLLCLNTFANSYPLAPDPILTPGSLCTTPDRYRYPEEIAYCERDVNSFLKESIFISYRNNLGYRLSGERLDYKVDHFIPLCAGGSNNQDNLWPQHISISKITDPIESTGCEKLSKGLITQKELVELIYRAKMDTRNAASILSRIKRLR